MASDSDFHYEDKVSDADVNGISPDYSIKSFSDDDSDDSSESAIFLMDEIKPPQTLGRKHRRDSGSSEDNDLKPKKVKFGLSKDIAISIKDWKHLQDSGSSDEDISKSKKARHSDMTTERKLPNVYNHYGAYSPNSIRNGRDSSSTISSYSDEKAMDTDEGSTFNEPRAGETTVLSGLKRRGGLDTLENARRRHFEAKKSEHKRHHSKLKSKKAKERGTKAKLPGTTVGSTKETSSTIFQTRSQATIAPQSDLFATATDVPKPSFFGPKANKFDYPNPGLAFRPAKKAETLKRDEFHIKVDPDIERINDVNKLTHLTEDLRKIQNIINVWLVELGTNIL